MQYSMEELKKWWAFLEWALPEDDYPVICDEIQRLGIKNIYEIGCGYGPHLGYIINRGFNYIGIDYHDSHPFYEKRNEFVDYKANVRYGVKYPCPLSPLPNSCAISVCALGSKDNESEIDPQMEQLIKEFKHFFCSTSIPSFYKMKKHWQHSEILRDEEGRVAVHFWNN